MDEAFCQKVVWSHVPMRKLDLENVNRVLGEGYEITDIIPYMEESGGGIYGYRRGLFVNSLLFQLAPSQSKT